MTPRADQRDAIVAATREAVTAGMWTCDDGHKHRRPARFTANRLKTEVNRRNPRNLWPAASMSCAVFDLIDTGELVHDTHGDFRLRVALDEERKP